MRILPSQSSVMKRKVGVDGLVDDVQVQSIPFCQWTPVGHGGATQRIDAQTQLRRFDAFEIHDVGQIGEIVADEIVSRRGRGLQRLVIRDAFDAV
jgi:hypothetical protein